MEKEPLPTITADTWNAMTEVEKAHLVNAYFPERYPPARARGLDIHLDLIGILGTKGYADGHTPY
jgi:hypothetical protein